jgi:hypothetical protein
MPRRAYRPAVRRLIAGLMAAIIGGVGSLAIATPSQAAFPCAVNYNMQVLSVAWETPVVQVNASITNTGSTSGHWSVYLLAPTGTTVQYWSVTPMPQPGMYQGASYNWILRAGETTNFGLILHMPPGYLDPAVIALVCFI